MELVRTPPCCNTRGNVKLILHIARVIVFQPILAIITANTTQVYVPVQRAVSYPSFRRIALLFSLLFLLIPFSLAEAQWVKVADRLLGKITTVSGCITHKSGIVWAAGGKELWMSPDSGTTWQKRSPTIFPNDDIIELQFISNTTGYVGTYSGQIYITHDQGLTWNNYYKSSTAYSIAVLGSENNVLVATAAGGTVDVTTDGGLSWKSVNLGRFVPLVRPMIGGSAIALGGDLPSGLTAYKTTDYGMTWRSLGGKVDADTYGMGVDKCEPNRIYVINENVTYVNGTNAQLFISIDGGNSFSVIDSHPRKPVYYTGAISLTSKAIFAQTNFNGILRSTDKGLTWQNIGGPSVVYDTRLVGAANANLIFAADSDGSIWKSVNSGGDSLLNIPEYEELSIVPFQLFTKDTLSNCDSAALEAVHFHSLLCSTPIIDTQYIIGKDSLDYRIEQGIKDSLASDDSVILSFRPFTSGPQDGTYVLVFKDGTKFFVPLKGFGKDIRLLSPASQSISLDTIGGLAVIPIRINGLSKPEHIEVVLHYDPKLKYEGSYLPDGRRIDKAGEQWDGRTKLELQLSDVNIDTTSAVAIFTVFPDGDTCFTAVLDSLNVLDLVVPCFYTFTPGIPIQICPPRGCGIMTITDFMLGGTMPHLSIRPNPARKDITLNTPKSLGSCKVGLYSSSGAKYWSGELPIKQGDTRLPIPLLTPGTYYLSIRSTLGSAVLPISIIE